MLGLDLGSSVQEKHGRTGESPTKSHEFDEGTWSTSLSCEERSRVGTIQPGEEQVQEGFSSISMTHLKGGCKENDARLFSVLLDQMTSRGSFQLQSFRDLPFLLFSSAYLTKQMV